MEASADRSLTHDRALHPARDLAPPRRPTRRLPLAAPPRLESPGRHPIRQPRLAEIPARGLIAPSTPASGGQRRDDLWTDVPVVSIGAPICRDGEAGAPVHVHSSCQSGSRRRPTRGRKWIMRFSRVHPAGSLPISWIRALPRQRLATQNPDDPPRTSETGPLQAAAEGRRPDDPQHD